MIQSHFLLTEPRKINEMRLIKPFRVISPTYNIIIYKH